MAAPVFAELLATACPLTSVCPLASAGRGGTVPPRARPSSRPALSAPTLRRRGREDWVDRVAESTESRGISGIWVPHLRPAEPDLSWGALAPAIPTAPRVGVRHGGQQRE